jgi:hypothetical protein
VRLRDEDVAPIEAQIAHQREKLWLGDDNADKDFE